MIIFTAAGRFVAMLAGPLHQRVGSQVSIISNAPGSLIAALSYKMVGRHHYSSIKSEEPEVQSDLLKIAKVIKKYKFYQDLDFPKLDKEIRA